MLPCGVDLERFRPLARSRARAQLGLDPDRPLPAVREPTPPARRSATTARSRWRARSASSCSTLGAVEPASVPLWINAANAVLVPSEREGFGLAVLEALACEVPVLATPVGIHPEALNGVGGTLCAPFDLERWRAAVEPHLRAPGRPATHLAGSSPSRTLGEEPPELEREGRVDGRPSAMRFSAATMAERVAAAWRAALQRSG